MRLAAVLLVLLLLLPVSTPAQSAPLRVTGKTATSVSLAWDGWDMIGAVRHDLYRDGVVIHSWGADNTKTAHTDTSVGWGKTFWYFLRITKGDGAMADTNTVWVSTDAAPATRLNVVLIVTDDQRWDTLQYMPNVQALLGQVGVTFAEAFASTPQCCPSRAGLLSGLFSHNHRVMSNRIGARAFDDASTIATWLRAAGYRTALIGKYLNGYAGSSCVNVYGQCFTNLVGVHPWPYQPPGWDDWHAFSPEGYYNYTLIENGSTVSYGSVEADYSTTILQVRAVDFIRTTPMGQPFFLLFTPYGPHRPATAAKPDRNLYSGIVPWRPPSWNEADVSDKPAWVQALPLLDAAAISEIDGLRRSQIETLQSIDRAVKAIYDAVTAAGRLESTVFIFASDNGLAWGEHRWNAKTCAYEECTRVPLVIRVPGGAARTDNHLVTLIDLVPAIASWTGILHPKMNGLSLARLVIDKDTSWRDALLLEMLDGDSTQQAQLYSAIRTKQHLYVEYLNGDRELYDLAKDTYQLLNVITDPVYALVVAALQSRLAALKGQ